MLLAALLASAPALPSVPQDGPVPRDEGHLAAPTAEQLAQWGEHRKLKILYAGSPGGSREAVFREFLSRWFDEVGVIGLGELDEARAEPYDVVIADWRSQYGNDGYPARDGGLARAPGQLPSSFAKPIITMSYVASHLRREYKLDWL